MASGQKRISSDFWNGTKPISTQNGDFIRPTFIDNHDMDRFLFAARGIKTALRRAAAVQMRLPGPPIIYYGTEVGLTQRHGKEDGFGPEASRAPMVWGDQQDRESAKILSIAYQRAASDRTINPPPSPL